MLKTNSNERNKNPFKRLRKFDMPKTSFGLNLRNVKDRPELGYLKLKHPINDLAVLFRQTVLLTEKIRDSVLIYIFLLL